jgi:hypothetical protein
MSAESVREKEIDFYRALLLDMPQERSLAGVLQLVVERLAARPQTALVRIWLLNPVDIQAAYPNCWEEDRNGNFLYLVASAGNPLNSPGEDWSRLNGEFSRFPVGERKVGKIAAKGKAIEIFDTAKDPNRVVRK